MKKIAVILLLSVCVCSFSCEKCNKKLYKAAKEGDFHEVKGLVKGGADINFQDDDDKETPLMEAADEGHFKIVKHLVAKGALLDVQDEDGDTALHKAAEEGHIKIVKFLVKSKAKIDLRNKKGRTPLEEAMDELKDAKKGTGKYNNLQKVVNYLKKVSEK